MVQAFGGGSGYNEVYYDNKSESYGDNVSDDYVLTFSDNMEELYQCLKDKNLKFER